MADAGGGGSPSRNAAAAAADAGRGLVGSAESPPASASFSVAHSPLKRIVTIPARSDDISPAVGAATAEAEEAARAFFLDAVASPRKAQAPQYDTYAARGSFQLGTSPLAGMAAGSRPMQRFAAGGPLPPTTTAYGGHGGQPPPAYFGAGNMNMVGAGGMAMMNSPYRYRSPLKSSGMAIASPDGSSMSINSPGGFSFDIASLEKEAELLQQGTITSKSDGDGDAAGEGESADARKPPAPPAVWAGYGPADLVGSSRGGPSQGQHHLPPPPPPPPPSSSHAHYRYHNGYVYHGGPPQPPPGQKRAQAQSGGEGKERNSSKPPFQVSPSSSSPSSTSSSSSSSGDPQAPASLFSSSCPLSSSAGAPHTHTSFADADDVHRAAIAGLNDPTGEDKRSKGKGKGKSSRGKKDGGVIAGKGTAATNKQVAKRQDKKEIRDGFHAQIRSIMDLEAQERVLNAQGRRTLRDPLDAEQISPMCTLIRGCMELYEIPSTSGDETITRKGLKFQSGPFKGRSPGQVCLRCIFCAPHVIDDEKGVRNTRVFSSSQSHIEYHVRNAYRTHFKFCPHIPAKVYDLIETIRNANARGGNKGQGKFYPAATGRLNLVDDPEEGGGGVRFGPGGMKFADGTTWADRGFGNGPGLTPLSSPPAVVPLAIGADPARSGSDTVDVDAPLVLSSSAKAAKKKPGRKRRADSTSGAEPKKRGRTSKQASSDMPPVAIPVPMEISPFVSATSDTIITVGGMPSSFFGSFDEYFGGIETMGMLDSSVPGPAAVSPPQQEQFPASMGAPLPFGASQLDPKLEAMSASMRRPASKPASKPEPAPQPKEPVVRKSRSGRVSKRPKWQDFATDEADIEDRISGAERRDLALSRADFDPAPIPAPVVPSVADPVPASAAPTSFASFGKPLSAYKTPKKSEPVDNTDPPKNSDDVAWVPGMPEFATVTPTPTAKAKAKAKSKANAKKAPSTKKKGRKKKGGRGMHSITYVTKGGKQSGKWTEEEENQLLEAMKLYDKDWAEVADFIGTRTPAQCKSKNQKIVLRRLKEEEEQKWLMPSSKA